MTSHGPYLEKSAKIVLNPLINIAQKPSRYQNNCIDYLISYLHHIVIIIIIIIIGGLGSNAEPDINRATCTLGDSDATYIPGYTTIILSVPVARW